MSVHKFELVITKPAERDYEDILSYTQQQWGGKQRVIYKGKIEKALQALTKKPTMGKQKSGHRIYRVEKHRIFYRIEDTQIRVLRILHERMDAGLHLGE